MPPGPLPANPSLEQLRKQAKKLRDHVRTGRLHAIKKVPEARMLARELHPRWAGTSLTAAEWTGFTLADGQLTVARSPGTVGPRNVGRRAVPTWSTSSCGWPA